VISEEIRLIPDDCDKRQQQLQLAVSKLRKINKLSWEEIRVMVKAIDPRKLGNDGFSIMAKLAPTKEELELVKQYTGDIEMLDLPSRWIYEMRTVPRFASRIENFIQVLDWPAWYADFSERIKLFKIAWWSFNYDQRWIKFLKILLEVGNVILDGNRRGGA
jgi:hypothetical protein